jgi:hypothetical protein
LHVVAERIITDLCQQLQDSVSRVDHDKLVKAARDKTDWFAALVSDEQKKTKVAQGACIEMRVQIDEDQATKQ